MRFLLFGLKNIARNRRRSTTILGMIALGSTALLLAGGYAAATFRGLREATIASGLGHVQIGGPGFREDEEHPLASGLADIEAVRAIVRADSRVRAAAARIEFSGLVSNGDKSVVFLGRGVEPDEEYAAAGFRLTMRAGRALSSFSRSVAAAVPNSGTPVDPNSVAPASLPAYVAPNSVAPASLPASAPPAEAILAVGLARALHAKPGDHLTILAQTVDGALNGADVEVVGTYTTGVREMDERALIIGLPTAQAILSTTRVSKLVVALDKTTHTAEVQTALTQRLSAAGHRVELANWSDLASFYHQVRGLYSGIFLFLGLIIVGLVVLSSGNAMTMAVMERVKEIGTLMAVGTSRPLVMLMFVTEGLGLGVLGGALGAALGYGLARVLTDAGITMPPPPTFTSGVPLVIDVVPVLWAAVPALMAATMLMASLLPAARAARLRITDALGH